MLGIAVLAGHMLCFLEVIHQCAHCFIAVPPLEQCILCTLSQQRQGNMTFSINPYRMCIKSSLRSHLGQIVPNLFDVNWAWGCWTLPLWCPRSWRLSRVQNASAVPCSAHLSHPGGWIATYAQLQVAPHSFFFQDSGYHSPLMYMTCLRELHFSVCPFLSHLQTRNFNCCLTP